MYQFNVDGPSLTRLEDGVFIPPVPENADYQAYLVWVAAGNTALPADNSAYLSWLADGHTLDDVKPKNMTPAN
jgi:hypothetical protein